jgi:hypothetical protein
MLFLAKYEPPPCTEQNDLCYYHEEYGVPKVRNLSILDSVR